MHKGGLRLEDVIWIGAAAVLVVALLIVKAASGDELTVRETTTTRYDVDLSKPEITLLGREKTETRYWGPSDDIPPTGDKWGLIAASEREAKAIGDGNALKAAAAFELAAQSIEDGEIVAAEIRKTIELALRVLLKSSQFQQWNAAAGRMIEAINAVSEVDTKAETVEALRYVSDGFRNAGGSKVSVASIAQSAVAATAGEPAFLDDLLDFIERFLPLLLKILELLGGLS